MLPHLLGNRCYTHSIHTACYLPDRLNNDGRLDRARTRLQGLLTRYRIPRLKIICCLYTVYSPFLSYEWAVAAETGVLASVSSSLSVCVYIHSLTTWLAFDSLRPLFLTFRILPHTGVLHHVVTYRTCEGHKIVS